jgi:hypothetical protein
MHGPRAGEAGYEQTLNSHRAQSTSTCIRTSWWRRWLLQASASHRAVCGVRGWRGGPEMGRRGDARARLRSSRAPRPCPCATRFAVSPPPALATRLACRSARTCGDEWSVPAAVPSPGAAFAWRRYAACDGCRRSVSSRCSAQGARRRLAHGRQRRPRRSLPTPSLRDPERRVGAWACRSRCSSGRPGPLPTCQYPGRHAGRTSWTVRRAARIQPFYKMRRAVAPAREACGLPALSSPLALVAGAAVPG